MRSVRRLVLVASLFVLVTTCRRERADRAEIPAPVPEVTGTSATQEPVACVAAADRLCPVDEGTRDPAFAAFRDALRDAVRAKSESRLLKLVDPNIRTSFGGGGGIDDFKKQWKTSSPESEVWAELAAIADMGGKFVGAGPERSFWAPYVYAAWPETYDAFQHVAAVRDSVPIRRNAAPEAAPVTTVSWAILELVSYPGAQREGWLRVKAPDGQEGWVAEADVRSPVGYRAGFSIRRGRWLMEALVAGD